MNTITINNTAISRSNNTFYKLLQHFSLHTRGCHRVVNADGGWRHRALSSVFSAAAADRCGVAGHVCVSKFKTFQGIVDRYTRVRRGRSGVCTFELQMRTGCRSADTPARTVVSLRAPSVGENMNSSSTRDPRLLCRPTESTGGGPISGLY